MNDIELKRLSKSSREAREYLYRIRCNDCIVMINNLRKAYNDLWQPEPYFVGKGFRIMLKILEALTNEESLKRSRK